MLINTNFWEALSNIEHNVFSGAITCWNAESEWDYGKLGFLSESQFSLLLVDKWNNSSPIWR